jgi:hypothetical protein
VWVLKSWCRGIWQSQPPPIHFPYLVLVPHKIFVDSLSEKFSVLKALERKTKSPNMQALYSTANNFARAESTAFGASDEINSSFLHFGATAWHRKPCRRREPRAPSPRSRWLVLQLGAHGRCAWPARRVRAAPRSQQLVDPALGAALSGVTAHLFFCGFPVTSGSAR